MSTSSILIFLILGTVLISTIDSHQGSKSQLPESPTGDENPSLNCVLFGTQACQIECALTSQLYGYKSQGTCFQNQRCICRPSSKIPTSLHQEWKKKFDAEYVYNLIKHNDPMAEEVERIMSNPLATGDELKKEMKPLFSPYQYSQIKIKGDELISTFIRNGVVDEKAVQKHISDQLDQYWKYASRDRSLLNADYQTRFRQDLENIRDKGTLYNYAYRVARSQNKILKNILEEYLKSKGIEVLEVELDKEPNVPEVLHFLIINEFIKRNDLQRNQIGNQKANLVRSPSSPRFRRF